MSFHKSDSCFFPLTVAGRDSKMRKTNHSTSDCRKYFFSPVGEKIGPGDSFTYEKSNSVILYADSKSGSHYSLALKHAEQFIKEGVFISDV